MGRGRLIMKKKAVNFHPQVDLSIGDKYLLKSSSKYYFYILDGTGGGGFPDRNGVL